MTVKELIEHLKTFDETWEVRIENEYGSCLTVKPDFYGDDDLKCVFIDASDN